MEELIKKIYYDVEDKETDLFKITLDTFYFKGLAPDVRCVIWDTFDEANIGGHFGDVYLYLREYEYECV